MLFRNFTPSDPNTWFLIISMKVNSLAISWHIKLFMVFHQYKLKINIQMHKKRRICFLNETQHMKDKTRQKSRLKLS